MNVGELITMLEGVDPEREVFVSSDEEGNSYRPANISVDDIMCDQGGKYSEWVSVHPDDLRDGEYEGWEDKMVDAVVVW